MRLANGTGVEGRTYAAMRATVTAVLIASLSDTSWAALAILAAASSAGESEGL